MDRQGAHSGVAINDSKIGAGDMTNAPLVIYEELESPGYCRSVAVALKAIHRHTSSRDHAPGERLRNARLSIDVTFWNRFRRGS
jgi:hypothetical protein